MPEGLDLSGQLGIDLGNVSVQVSVGGLGAQLLAFQLGRGHDDSYEPTKGIITLCHKPGVGPSRHSLLVDVSGLQAGSSRLASAGAEPTESDAREDFVSP